MELAVENVKIVKSKRNKAINGEGGAIMKARNWNKTFQKTDSVEMVFNLEQ